LPLLVCSELTVNGCEVGVWIMPSPKKRTKTCCPGAHAKCFGARMATFSMVVPPSTLSTKAGIPEWVIYIVRRTCANQARRYIAPVAMK
jgi:hypothetical protein